MVDRTRARDGPERYPVLIAKDSVSYRVSSMFNAGATRRTLHRNAEILHELPSVLVGAFPNSQITASGWFMYTSSMTRYYMKPDNQERCTLNNVRVYMITDYEYCHEKDCN